ncbi:MAG TPA: carboxypeptidase-like regulatory domain-containing protein, partial [Pyrinomonadaceae bacterium]|nr:carboxypeptidase-like regulatory domain-containing protein [Pyrinomonadaceae bacterium]
MVALKLSNLRYLLILFVLLAGLPFRASGQEATIVGTVTDPSGAAVANAKITLTNMETTISRIFTTNDSGQYVAVDMHIGHYNVKAEASGFKVAEQKDLALQVGDRTRVDFQLALGAATETVTVEANAVRVQADSGEVSNVIDGSQIENLSINGRGIYQLAALAPGASSQIDTTAPNTPVGGSAGVEYNGLRQNHNIYLLDGGEDDDRGGAGGMSIAPSPDAIAEFRTLTSNYSADYGLSSAGTNVL